MTILATDDEKLACELWGDEKYWDDDLNQYVPNDGKLDKRKGGAPSAGNSSGTSSDRDVTSKSKNESAPRTTAPTTERSSSQGQTVGSTAPSTAGSGTAKQSPGKGDVKK